MKISSALFAAVLAAAIPFSAQAKIERVVEKTFTVKPGGLLTVETQGGDVRVETAAGDTIKVVAKERIRASSEADADALLQNLDLTIEAVDGGVSAIAKYEKKSIGFHLGEWPPVQVSFVVTVPANYNANLRTSGGDVTVGDLNGTVKARTSGGNVSLGKIGKDVDAHTSGGDVRLVECAASVKLGTSGGNISVDRAVGPTALDTSGGNIKIGSVENTLHASTSGGDISAGIDGALKGDCSLGTSGGRVRVKVAKGTAFDLDASTSGGDVDAEGLTITIEKGGVGKSRLAGKVNGGGPKLRLRSSGGDIDVETR